MANSIEDIIRAHITFHSISGAWNRLYCELCGDGSRTKGPRAAFLFEGVMCQYSCFNCGYRGSFDPGRDLPWSSGMGKVFKAFGVPISAIKQLIADTRASLSLPTVPIRLTRLLQPIEPPEHFYSLSSASEDNVIASKAKAYLHDVKHIDHSAYPFYLSTAIAQPNDPDAAFIKSLRNRLIIPFFKADKLVYYIARSMDEDSSLKYINLNKPKGNIIYGFDRLYEDVNSVLFICEGFFDAYHTKGVAVLENSMTADQIDILNQSPRKKVVIPDRCGDSNKLAEQAIELGWGISVPKMGECKDVTEAIGHYGKLYMLDSIMKSIKHGRQAEIALKTL